MVLIQKFYKYSEDVHDDRVGIAELDREDFMTPQYMEMFKEELNSIKLEGTVGFVYSCGATVHQAENRVCSRESYTNSLKGTRADSPFVAKSMTAYMMHKYLGLLGRNGNNITMCEIVSNTCASSLYAVILAEEMLKTVDHVVVVTEEKTSFDTIRIFHEHKIDVKASDGFACAVFSNVGEGIEVHSGKKAFLYNSNPFLACEEGYRLVDQKSDMVKVHGTGTKTNDEAEDSVFGNRPMIRYKDKIGHSQGSSGLLEICMCIDDVETTGDVLCVASGFGGFYGSIIVRK